MSGQSSGRRASPRSSSDTQSPRFRKDHDPVATVPVPTHGAPTSFFLATEAMLSKPRSSSDNQAVDSTFGVRSIPEATEGVKQEQLVTDGNSRGTEEDNGRRRSTLKACHNQKSREGPAEESAHDQNGINGSPPFGFPRLSSTLPSVSSLSQGSQGVGRSLPSSPKSASSRFGRPSDEDSVYDSGSQAIASSEDEADRDWAPVPDNAPQLIMPSIQMPSRRPFTERGRSIGRLKILLAGDSGLGKTSLIKSIVQLCEDIVHVDPVTSNASSIETLSESMDKARPLAASYLATTQINEVWASTKAFPAWWTDLEENRSLRRRKSVDDPVLERNICFVDTPGYGRGLSITEGIQTVISYIEEQLPRSFSAAASNRGEVVSMLSGNGGAQVDAVLYLIGKEVRPADIEFLQRLSQVTNVVPLVAQADMIESDNIAALKQSISDELRQLGIQYFSFNSLNPPSPPYAVSSAPSNDEDNMDASLLMSSGYIQPLLPSELGIVINLLFDRDNIARMRHMSAKKVVHSRAALQFLTKTPLILGSATETAQTNSSFGVSQTLTSNAVQPPIHAHLQVAEYTRREEKLAQIRLAKWANDLRRTMRDERVHFETLQQAERTTWLSQKLEECNQDAASPTAKNMVRCELASHASPFGLTHANDPLGLLRFDGYLRRHGLRIFQVVGTFGAFGAVALWVARNWSSCSDWSWTWGECRTWAC